MTVSRPTARPSLETLESRLVPTVLGYGGNILPHVEAQALYYGQDWSSNSTLRSQTGYLDGFVKNIVNSGYMDMLTNAGYGVGRGSATPGRILLTNPNKAYFLTDSSIRSTLQADINNHSVATPDSNRLYIIYVEANVAVMNDHDYNPQKGRYENSIQDFGGYHTGFAGTDGYGHSAVIHYAVIPYAGGTVHNGVDAGLTALQQDTAASSHELAEAVTDPNVNVPGKALGWYDPQRGEIGDIVNGQFITYHGYVVQKEANKNDQAIVPPDYTGYASAFSTLINTSAVGGNSAAPVNNALSAADHLFSNAAHDPLLWL